MNTAHNLFSCAVKKSINHNMANFLFEKASSFILVFICVVMNTGKVSVVHGAVGFSCVHGCEAPKSDKCTIVVRETLRLDHAADTSFDCLLDPLDAGGKHNIIVPIHMTLPQKQMLQIKCGKGEIRSHISTLRLDRRMEINASGLFISRTLNHYGLVEKFGTNHIRKLTTTVGIKHFLVVKVTDSQGRKLIESLDQISDDIFGTSGDAMTLKSQMNECSFGKFNVTAGIGSVHEIIPGVIEVTIDISLVGNDRVVIRNAVTEKVQTLLGYNLPGPYSNVMYILEGCHTGKHSGIKLQFYC